MMSRLLEDNNAWKDYIDEYKVTQDVSLLSEWQPHNCGKLNIKIDSSGAWYFNETIIVRKKMVALFSSILVLEGLKYILVTPIEKIEIEVEDVPFLIIDYHFFYNKNSQKNELFFLTNIGNIILVNDALKTFLFCSIKRKEQNLYIEIRNGLLAKLSRNVFYALIELSELVEVGDLLAWVVKNNGVDLMLGIEKKYPF